MLIRFKATFGAHYPGATADVSPQIADNLVRIGIAEPVTDDAPPPPPASATEDYTTGKRTKAVSK